MPHDEGALQRRVIELEIRAEEQQEAMRRLEGFVAAYEQRVTALEARLRELRADDPEPLPPPLEDLPPHY